MVTSLADRMWNRVCLYNEIMGYMQKLPSPKVSWRSDRSDTVGIQWLHDYRRPEWGYVSMWIPLEGIPEYFEQCIMTLQIEIKRYELMQQGVKVENSHRHQSSLYRRHSYELMHQAKN